MMTAVLLVEIIRQVTMKCCLGRAEKFSEAKQRTLNLETLWPSARSVDTAQPVPCYRGNGGAQWGQAPGRSEGRAALRAVRTREDGVPELAVTVKWCLGLGLGLILEVRLTGDRLRFRGERWVFVVRVSVKVRGQVYR